jgi:hypothetical protein
MPESLPGESELRPDIVRAIIRAMADNDSATLNDLLRGGVTTAEYVAAMNAYGEGTTVVDVVADVPEPPSRRDRSDRDFEVVKLLVGERMPEGATGWPDLFDALPLGRLPQLHELYDALPDGARAEYDRRFGPP